MRRDDTARGVPPRDGLPHLIEIRNATVWRGFTRVFDGLDLTIRQGECVAILGPNGSGKTTLLDLVTRNLYPVSEPGASVRILGRRRWNVHELRRHIGIVSDDLDRCYRTSHTALDVVLSGFFASVGVHGLVAREIHDSHREAAARVLDDLGLSALASRRLDQMSTGQKRRSILGRALVHDPHTLILDEPTAGLDLTAAFDLLARVRGLAQSGRSILVVTHHLSDIPPEVDRVVLLDRGCVVADGAKAEVLTEDRLSRVYRTPLRIAELDGYYFAYPGPTLGGKPET